MPVSVRDIVEQFATRLAADATVAEINPTTVAVVDTPSPELTDRRLFVQVVPGRTVMQDKDALTNFAEVTIDAVVFLRVNLDQNTTMRRGISGNDSPGESVLELAHSVARTMRGSYLGSTLLTPLRLASVSAVTAQPNALQPGTMRATVSFDALADIDLRFTPTQNDGTGAEVV